MPVITKSFPETAVYKVTCFSKTKNTPFLHYVTTKYRGEVWGDQMDIGGKYRIKTEDLFEPSMFLTLPVLCAMKTDICIPRVANLLNVLSTLKSVELRHFSSLRRYQINRYQILFATQIGPQKHIGMFVATILLLVQ